MAHLAKPYPPTGLTTKRWDLVPVQEVKIDDLQPTQDHLSWHAMRYGRLQLPVHVVSYRGTLYLENGHHRVMQAYVRGVRTVKAHVLVLGP